MIMRSNPLFYKDLLTLKKVPTIVKEKSIFQTIFIIAFVIIFVAFLWALFFSGFRFLGTLGNVGSIIIRHLFSLFFLGLGVMLILSNVLSFYSLMFASPELPFLLVKPVSLKDIFLHKIIESAIFSSWSFFFIIIPFIGAFVQYEKLPSTMIFWTFIYAFPFLILCAFLAAFIVMMFLKFLPNIRPSKWLLGIVLLVVVLFLIDFRARYYAAEDRTSFVISSLVPGIKIASMPFLPSWWVAQAIVSVSQKDWMRSFMFFGLLVSTTAVIGFAIYDLCATWIRYIFLKLKDSTSSRAIYKKNTFSIFNSITLPLPYGVGAIIKKDILNMWRDAVWWLQGMMFFGLLALYFLNIRNMHYHMLSEVWRNLIAFLNIFSLGAIMSSFCSRFIYPQLSLEGNAFWIFGLAPTSMPKILVAKFLSSSAIMLVINLILIYISSLMLDVIPSIKITAILLSIFMTFSLCAIATGVGAIFIDPGKTDPVKIVSGFGGTLNLVLSLGYIILTISPFGILFHYYTTGVVEPVLFRKIIVVAYLWLIVISAISVIIPLKLGCDILKKRDY